MDNTPSDIAAGITANLRSLHARIHAAQRPIALVAVSKTQNTTTIQAAIDAGQRLFGENRVQEALAKWPALKQRYPDIKLHLIGPLQTNKVAQALTLFEVIETLDRPKLADMLAKAQANGKQLPECYIQVNIGKEPQKSGIMPEAAGAFIHYCRDQLHLPVTGIMCIPPAGKPPEAYFQQLATMAHTHGLTQISMGMSGDFEAAIAAGATHIRLGHAVFKFCPHSEG